METRGQQLGIGPLSAMSVPGMELRLSVRLGTISQVTLLSVLQVDASGALVVKITSVGCAPALCSN